MPCSVCCLLLALPMAARLTACSVLTPFLCTLQIAESFISLLAAMEPAAEGKNEALASYQAWRTWTLGVLQAFLRGHSASLALVAAQLQQQVSDSAEILDDVRTVLNLYCKVI